jgi:hypothetical protein
MAQIPLSASHGFPRLWSSHFLRHLKSICSDVVKCTLEALLSGRKLDETVLMDGFRTPSLAKLHSAQRDHFVDQMLTVVGLVSMKPLPSCPEPLLELLLDNFQVWEAPDHFERFRTYRIYNMEYEPVPVSRDLLAVMFQGKCTRQLGQIIQPRKYCSSTNTILCRACKSYLIPSNKPSD